MPSQLCPDLGIRYRAMLPPTVLQGLSTAAATTLHNFETAFSRQEQGGVRNGNDRTTDSRARHFVRWLAQQGITSPDIITLIDDNTQAVKIIAAFAWDIKQGYDSAPPLSLDISKLPPCGSIPNFVKPF